jgi:hypothetical protein
VGNGQTGGTATDNDKVILAAELGNLPLCENLSPTGKGLDDAEDGRADSESLEKTHF